MFKILLSCCQWCSKVSAKTTDSCCVCELFAIMFRSEFKLEVQNRFMAPFFSSKIIFFGWIDSGSVHTIIFFPRTSLQLCIVCHGTSCCDRWKIIEIISLHLFCIHAISISVSVAGHVLNIHKKYFRIVGFPPWKNILVDVSLSKSELISFSKKGMIYVQILFWR